MNGRVWIGAPILIESLLLSDFLFQTKRGGESVDSEQGTNGQIVLELIDTTNMVLQMMMIVFLCGKK